MTNAHFFSNLRPRTWLPWEQSCNTPIKCKHRRCACGSSVRSRWDTCNLRSALPRSARYRTYISFDELFALDGNELTEKTLFPCFTVWSYTGTERCRVFCSKHKYVGTWLRLLQKYFYAASFFWKKREFFPVCSFIFFRRA